MAAGILFGILFLMLFVGVPIAICLGIAAAATMFLTGNVQYLAAVPTRMFTQLDSFTLMAVPFFILAGNIMAEGGISARLIGFLELLLKRLRLIAKKRNIELLFESFRPVTADIDEVKLNLAVTNLVENAIKYNQDSGWVKVSLNADHKFFYIKVTDNGCGIPEDAVEHIFERFYRVDKARSRETGGTGLGLSITKTIVQLHHGAIKVHSKLQEGTTFVVRIPMIYIKE